MRTKLGIMAACLLGLASPASALVQLSLSGTMKATQSTVMCGTGPSAAACLATYPDGLSSRTYESDFTQLVVLPFDLKQGANDFTYGALRSGGYWSGVINNDNGVLTGRELNFSYLSSAYPTIGTTTLVGSASAFAVTAVPEPATWALMLLGFLAIGTAMRSAPRRALQPA